MAKPKIANDTVTKLAGGVVSLGLLGFVWAAGVSPHEKRISALEFNTPCVQRELGEMNVRLDQLQAESVKELARLSGIEQNLAEIRDSLRMRSYPRGPQPRWNDPSIEELGGSD
jgi:hypothetical protein